MASIFTHIINGEIPSHKVAETDSCLAFLDINPLGKGHTLVVPKKEVDQLFHLDNSTYSDLMQFAKDVSHALQDVIACKRIGMTVIGLEVPHAHVHLIPINGLHDMEFSRGKVSLSEEEMKDVAEQISQAYQNRFSS